MASYSTVSIQYRKTCCHPTYLHWFAWPYSQKTVLFIYIYLLARLVAGIFID